MNYFRLLPVLLLSLLVGVVTLPSQGKEEKKEEAPKQKFHTGGKPTPFLKLVAAIKAGKVGIYRSSTAPPQVIVVPKKLSVWGNNQYGICVTSESCFAISDYSTYVGLNQIFVTEATCIKWAKDRGYLNGAWLLEVIEDMQKDGIKDEGGILRRAGKASTVDYSNEETLKSAIAQGPLSIAIDSRALPSGAGDINGWSAFGGKSYGNTDHCVGLHGYGPTAELFKALNSFPPANAPANGYLLFTWGTVGVVDHKWLMNTCVEAWVRNPTTTDLTPPNPPQPGKITVTTPNVSGGIDVPVTFKPTASGGTSPYIFLFEYGDGAQDAGGSHSYKEVGSYKVTITAVDSVGQLGVGTCTASIGTTPPIPPGPTPGGLTLTLPQDTPAGVYQLVLPSDLDEIQRRLDAIRGLKGRVR